MSAGVAEKLLNGATFYVFVQEKYEQRVIRSATRYRVPGHICKHVDFIGGIYRFPFNKYLKRLYENRGRLMTEKALLETYGTTPTKLRERDNLSKSDVGSNANNSQCIAGFLQQYFSNNDLTEFMTYFVGNKFKHLSKISKVIGGKQSGLSGSEASLDTQYIMSTGANIKTWFWGVKQKYENEEVFLQWLIDIAGTETIPYVLSVSYGGEKSSLSPVYMKRVNIEFMKVGLRGVSVLYASGDTGADCANNKFAPEFPVNLPYVTAVGGTQFTSNYKVTSEVAYAISGGGFSNVFKQPSYQASNVAAYLASGIAPSTQYFDKTGRAYPDVAAISKDFWIVTNQLGGLVDGTSASTPTVAGIISMVNEHRLQNNKPTMGFLNPFIYKNSQAFNDVTLGCNYGCLTGDIGFCSTTGFDPVTGMGSPNFPKLVKAAMAIFDKKNTV